MSDFFYGRIKLSNISEFFTEEKKRLIDIASNNLNELNRRFDLNVKIYYDGESFIGNCEHSEYFAEMIADIVKFEFDKKYTERMFLDNHINKISTEYDYLKSKILDYKYLDMEEKNFYLHPRLVKFFKTYKNSYCPIIPSLTKSSKEDYSAISYSYTEKLNKIQNVLKIEI